MGKGPGLAEITFPLKATPIFVKMGHFSSHFSCKFIIECAGSGIFLLEDHSVLRPVSGKLYLGVKVRSAFFSQVAAPYLSKPPLLALFVKAPGCYPLGGGAGSTPSGFPPSFLVF